MSVKRGDVVLYVQGGRTYNALVLAAHSINDSHLGANQEPQLHLSVLFEEAKGKVAPIGFIPEPTTVHDVVHASHKFDAAYLESRGLSQRLSADQKVLVTAEIHSHRGAGEWREAIVADAGSVAENLVAEPQADGDSGESQAASD